MNIIMCGWLHAHLVTPLASVWNAIQRALWNFFGNSLVGQAVSKSDIYRIIDTRVSIIELYLVTTFLGSLVHLHHYILAT